MKRFIQDNGLKSAKILPIGLSSENGICKLYSTGDADVMASLDRSEQHLDEIIIPTRRGDEVLRELGVSELAAIKIDVEGAELKVMHGFRETLSSLQPPIIFEVLPNFEGPNRVPVEKPMAAKRSEAANEIYSFLSSIGYRIYLIDERGDEILIDRFELDDPASFIGTNFIARPSDQPK